MKYPPRFSPVEKEILKSVCLFGRIRKVRVYLVGGILRDMFLGRRKENPDFDFCLKKGAIGFGRSLAKRLKCGFVILDREHGACRLVKKTRARVYTLDFTDFRGKDLEQDLARRDFTINTLSAELERLGNGYKLEEALFDPYQARRDLRRRVIKAASKDAFKDDPLRMLRAFSLASTLGFCIDKDTLRLIRLHRKRLHTVSPERIREELFKILKGDAFSHLLLMDKLKILEVVFPEIKKMRGLDQGPYHHLDIWRHTLESLRQLEALLEELKAREDIRGFLNEVISADHSRRELLKLGLLLHDIGKPAARRREGRKIKFHGHERIGERITEDIARRLRFSNDEIDALKTMVMWHLRPGYLADNERQTPRAVFRYFRDTDKEAVSVLLLSLADQRATRGPLTTRVSRIRHEKVCLRLIKEYFRRKSQRQSKRLINGNDLIKRFGLEPSPIIGKVLAGIEELQAIGKIDTKEEALRESARLIKRMKKG